jgi:hypothetical protein
MKRRRSDSNSILKPLNLNKRRYHDDKKIFPVKCRPFVYYYYFDIPLLLRKNIGMKSDKNLYFIHATKSKNTELKSIGVNIAGQETYLDSLIYDSNKPIIESL